MGIGLENLKQHGLEAKQHIFTVFDKDYITNFMVCPAPDSSDIIIHCNDDAEGKELTVHIVKCVNAHKRLVDTVKDFHEWERRRGEACGDCCETCALLVELTGEQPK